MNKTKRNKPAKHFTLAKQEINALKKHSNVTGLSESEIVRRALDKYFGLERSPESKE